LSNPGSGFTIQGNNILAFVNGRWMIAGYFRYLGPDQPRTFAALVHQTGQLADRWLKEKLTEMAKGTALTVGTGLVARAGLDIIVAVRRPDLIFKTATFGQKLTDAGVDVGVAKAAVGHVISSRLGNHAPIGVLIKGTVNVRGRILEFTAMRLPSGEISVGSIRVPR
jgi:hypothetical protein